jgi:hypothetical protein
MAFKFDYFVAPLRCAACGAVALADHSTGMQTAIRDEPRMAYLGVGHALDVRPEAVADRGYLTVQAPPGGGPYRILQRWDCPACGSVHNWAEVVVSDGVIASIAAVVLDRPTLERCHFLDEEAKGVAAAMAGREYTDLTYDDVVPIFRKNL